MLNYIELGQGEGKETLVFIHGYMSKKESWEHQFLLAKDFHIIAVDNRGHGESNTTVGISMYQFAKDIIDLLDHLGIDKAHFCGLSMGGVITQEIYKQFPKRVKSMILSNTFSISAPRGFDFLLGSLYKGDKKVNLKEATIAGAKKCVYHKSRADLVEEVSRIGLELKPDTAKATFPHLFGINYLTMLPFVQVPTLVIAGVYDELAPIILAKQTFMFTNPKYRDMAIFGRASHMPNIEYPKQYNEAVLKFLKEE